MVSKPHDQKWLPLRAVGVGRHAHVTVGSDSAHNFEESAEFLQLQRSGTDSSKTERVSQDSLDYLDI